VSVVRYAAYGSNLHPVRLTDRLPSARLVGPGFLPGHSLEFHKRSLDESGKCTIAAGGEGVYVAIYDVSEDDKRRLDAIEGVGRGYSDDVVDVPGFSACSTYVAEPAYVEPGLRPYDWYRELVLLGCRFHGFSDDYIARIAAIASVSDPDASRQAGNRKLIERMRIA
jgi:hypothetical protein